MGGRFGRARTPPVTSPANLPAEASGPGGSASAATPAASPTAPLPEAQPRPSNLYSDRIRSLMERTQASVESYLIMPFRAPLHRAFSSSLIDRTRSESDVSFLNPDFAGGSAGVTVLEEKRRRLSADAMSRIHFALPPGSASQAARPALIVERGHEADALFQLASFTPEEVLLRPRVHYCGEEGRDAGGLLFEWAEAAATQLGNSAVKPVRVLRVAGAPEASKLNGEYTIVGLCCGRPSYRKMGRNDCTIFYSKDSGAWQLGENAGSDFSVRTWFQLCCSDPALPDAVPLGTWELPPSASLGYCGLDPAPTVVRLADDSVEVHSAGEEGLNGIFLQKATANGRPIFRKKDAEHCTIYWTDNYKEWRMFIKGYKGNRSLYQSFEQSDHCPLGSWIVTCGHPGGPGFSGPRPSVDHADLEELFVEAPDGTLMPKPKEVQPSADAVVWRFYVGVGRLLGLALVRSLPLPVSLNRATLKLLLGRDVSPHDVESIDPDFFEHRLQAVMRPGGIEQIEAALCEPLTFVSAPTPLCPEPVPLRHGGERERVTEDNKREYLRLLCEFFLVGLVRTEIALILDGFHDIVPLDEFTISCSELARLLCGMPSFDVDEWEEHTECNKTLSPAKRWFFQLLRESDQDVCGKCLHFVTGASRLPPGGFAGLRPRFQIHIYSPDNPELLPQAHTCANTLDLPEYGSEEQFRERLFLALEHSEGYGFH